MRGYLDIIEDILENGKKKENRTGIDTIGLPNLIFSHDMGEGFPLLTTKRMPFKTISVELEGFLGGITDKKWYQDRGCKIWNEWGNPCKVADTTGKLLLEKGLAGTSIILKSSFRKKIAREERDLGPIYGYQWRNFNGGYRNYDDFDKDGVDQLENIVNTLHNDPNDRRMVCSAWNPQQIHQMALPPCHYSWSITIIGGHLNLSWEQRSCDCMLGVPFNIASYALLLILLAKEGGFKQGNLTGILKDAHIYENQIDGARLQIQREPKELPTLTLFNFSNIFQWNHKEVKLENYKSEEKIDFGKVAI